MHKIVLWFINLHLLTFKNIVNKSYILLIWLPSSPLSCTGLWSSKNHIKACNLAPRIISCLLLLNVKQSRNKVKQNISKRFILPTTYVCIVYIFNMNRCCLYGAQCTNRVRVKHLSRLFTTAVILFFVSITFFSFPLHSQTSQ